MDKKTAKLEIGKLIKTFKDNFNQYKLSTYKEAQVRIEFIDKFFKELGWDIDNTKGLPEQFKEVISEDSIKIGGKTKAPDYAFRVGNQRMFFVEAKKPSVNLKLNPESAYQLRRYAWNMGIPISILTDFEEFVIYDCRVKPNEKDDSSVARIMIINFEDYLSKFDEIWNIFSRESVWDGSFDKFVEAKKGMKGTTEVDDSFLKEIEKWRENLAKNIALRNPSLNISGLNFSVQKIIDRILFLIISEYKSIERYGRLGEISKVDDVYNKLNIYFKEADDKYNSGIFDFSKDSITPNLIIDDRILKDIIINLYYPKSPYDFSVLPIEILGKVYERFLGKTIRLTPSHKAKVEDKPEVKKAGGIFYTPEYIVDYIVKNTVGKLIKGKTPQQIEKIKILDSACGSGTFLVRAYSYILDYLLEYYMEHPERYKKLVYQTKKGHWFLTTEVRKHVLLNNIFGIDIDSQAVEVTKLSLLLKVLENETKEGVSQQLKLFNERALPSLDKNIKCGNSLVGHKFYYKKHITLSDDDKSKRINIFDWEDKEEGFGKIMDEGGFDIIIGNPPYIQIQKLKEFYPDEIDFIQNNYSTAKEKNIDIYLPFIEKGISLLKQKGYLGYICPNRFFNSEYGKNMRDYLKNYNIYHLVNFRHYFVFKNADAYTCLLFIQKDKQASSLTYKEVKDLYKTNDGRLQTLLNARKSQEHLIIDRIKPHFIKEDNWFFMTENESEILEKIKKNPIFSECYKENFQGLITGMDGVYILKLIKDKGKTKIFYSKELKKEVELESDLLFNIISDNNIDNYFVKDSDNFIIFPYEDGNLISSKDLEEKYPLIWKYLSNFKNKLKSRERNKFNNSKWYQYSRNQAIDKQRLTKILVPHIIKKMRSAYDDKGRYFIKNVGVNGICLKDSIEENPLYFLAILNSPISSFFISKISIFLSGGFYASNKQFAGKIPIKKIDFSNNEEKQDHDNIVNLVSSIIELNSKNNTMNNKEDLITRQINALYKNINNIIYKLYNITEQEKQIIEKS